MVEDERFRRLVNYLAPRYKRIVPSRKILTEKVVSLIYETLKTNVQTEINETDYICLTKDGWTSDCIDCIHFIAQVQEQY